MIRNKYRARRTVVDGHSFPSAVEAERFGQLVLLERAGHIRNLRCQPSLLLTAANIKYRPDFVYVEDGELVYEEVKGVATARWRLIQNLWRVYGPARLRIMVRQGGRIVCKEEIVPRRTRV